MNRWHPGCANDFPSAQVAPLVPRTELLDRVKELLLGEGGPPLIGLWGTAGVGKTAMLQMLWQDPEVQRHFDFPLWFELGLDADASLDADRAKQHLREQLSSWADGLSLPVADLSTVDQLSDGNPDALAEPASLDHARRCLVRRFDPAFPGREQGRRHHQEPSPAGQTPCRPRNGRDPAHDAGGSAGPGATG